MYGSLLLFDDNFLHIVSITFTSLILTELLMVALTIRTWHWVMIVCEIGSLGIYIVSLVVLKDFFGKWRELRLRFFNDHKISWLLRF